MPTSKKEKNLDINNLAKKKKKDKKDVEKKCIMPRKFPLLNFTR